MNNELEKGAVPRLRFKEFEGEWEEKTLGEVISLEYGSPLSEQNRNGGNIPVIGSNGIVGYHNESIVSGPAIVIGRKGSAGLVNWIASDCYPIDTTYYVVTKQEDKTSLLFLKLLLEKINLVRLKDAGAVPGLNRNEVYSIKTVLPSLPEQQKIAATLSSLDEVIGAESNWLDALKAHKRGLMQALFPAEGETIPRLRFKGFEGEWEEKKLGEVISLEYGSPLSEQNRNGGNIPVIGSNGIVGYHNESIVSGPAIVIGRKGSAGLVNWIASDCYPIDTTYYVVTKQEDKTSLLFLKLLLEKINLVRLKDAGAVPGLNRNEVYSIKTVLPSLPEQQKIAATLSSLDEVIGAESNRLDALKAHKRGLMQALFLDSMTIINSKYEI